jgi:hypothetical protein
VTAGKHIAELELTMAGVIESTRNFVIVIQESG